MDIDASGVAFGGATMKDQGDNLQPIVLMRCTLTPSEGYYLLYERKLAANATWFVIGVITSRSVIA